MEEFTRGTVDGTGALRRDLAEDFCGQPRYRFVGRIGEHTLVSLVCYRGFSIVESHSLTFSTPLSRISSDDFPTMISKSPGTTLTAEDLQLLDQDMHWVVSLDEILLHAAEVQAGHVVALSIRGGILFLLDVILALIFPNHHNGY